MPFYSFTVPFHHPPANRLQTAIHPPAKGGKVGSARKICLRGRSRQRCKLPGLKGVLGVWAAEAEGARFWRQVVTELKNRGVADIFIACVDGLKGFPEAIEAVFTQTKDRKAAAEGLKEVYQAVRVEQAERQLARFEEA